MAMNALISGVTSDYSSRGKPTSSAEVTASRGKPISSAEMTVSLERQVKTVQPQETVKKTSTEQPLLNLEFNGDREAQDTLKELVGKEKEPAKSTIDATMSSLNARMKKTRCAYAYDEDTKRITIKVYDSDSEELIREVPPEKSLEALKKVWELAGIIIDQKG